MSKKRKKKKRGGVKDNQKVAEAAAKEAASAAEDSVSVKEEASMPEDSEAVEGAAKETEEQLKAGDVKNSDVDTAEDKAKGADGESALAAALRERDEYLELARKTRAEMENYRRRVQRERENDKQRIQAELLRELITPFDDFERALTHAEEEKSFDTLYEGISMVRDAMWKAISSTGFEKIDGAPGSIFDPNIHEAMMQIPHHEHAKNVIVDEVASGYKLGDMVLRASKVVVSSGAPVEPDSGGGDGKG